MRVNHYAIYDCKVDNWKENILDKWVYDDFVADPTMGKEWISLTSLAYHKGTNQVFVGIGSFRSELLWRFDRAARTLHSCGYEKVGDRFDGKLHRSLELDGDTLYGGVALFHDIDKQFQAKGGRLVKYDIPTGKFTFLGCPWEPAYIQSIALDKKRQVIYGFGALPEIFFKHDLKTGESRLLAHIGNGCELAESHNPGIDEKGRVWGTYGILRAFSYRTGPDSIRLMRYDPDTDEVTFFPYGFPRTDMEGDKGKPDTMLLGPDGKLYVGTDYGVLARLDPETAQIEQLCKPHPDTKRMSALAFHPTNGLLYGFTGDHYDVHLFAYDTKKDELVFCKSVAAEDGVAPVRIHHMVFSDDGVIYAGENDNNDRSSYLWEVELS